MVSDVGEGQGNARTAAKSGIREGGPPRRYMEAPCKGMITQGRVVHGAFCAGKDVTERPVRLDRSEDILRDAVVAVDPTPLILQWYPGVNMGTINRSNTAVEWGESRVE